MEKNKKSVDAESDEFLAKIEEARDEVYGLLLKLTRHNEADAQDLTQDTLLRAMQNRDKFDNKPNIKPWILTIARNLFTNKYRRRQLEAKVGGEMKTDDLKGFDDMDHVDPILKKNIDQVIGLLSPERQAVIRLRMQNKSYKEISAELNIPLGTVMSQLFRATKDLRKLLSDDEDIRDI